MAEVTTSTQCKYPDFFIENEAFDWVEFQLVTYHSLLKYCRAFT